MVRGQKTYVDGRFMDGVYMWSKDFSQFYLQLGQFTHQDGVKEEGEFKLRASDGKHILVRGKRTLPTRRGLLVDDHQYGNRETNDVVMAKWEIEKAQQKHFPGFSMWQNRHWYKKSSGQ